MEKLRTSLPKIKSFAIDLLDAFVGLIACYLWVLATILVTSLLSSQLKIENLPFPISDSILLTVFTLYSFWVWGFLLGTKPYKTVLITTFIIWISAHSIIPFYLEEWIAFPSIAFGVFYRKKVPEQFSTIYEKQIKATLGAKIFLLLLFFFLLTFSIPHYSYHSHDGERMYTAIGKEAASMISGAYSTYTLKSKATAKTSPKNLIQYMNYVSINADNNYNVPPKTTDNHTQQGWLPFLTEQFKQLNRKDEISSNLKATPLQPCSERLQCLILHNGGVLQFDTQQTFGGTSATHAIFFNLDPDGYGAQGRISFYQYFDGKLTTGETKRPGTQTSATILTSQDNDPDYLPNGFN